MDPLPENKRLYVNGLFDGIKESDLIERFAKFGQVKSVELKAKRTEDGQAFAFLEMMITPKNLAKCFNVYSNTRWKGCEMKLEVAKEHFLSRLQKEREQAANKSKNVTSTPSNAFEPKPANKNAFVEEQDEESKKRKLPVDSPSPLKKSKNKVPMFQGTAALLQNEADELVSPNTKPAKKARTINGQAIEAEILEKPKQNSKVNGNSALNVHPDTPRPDFRNGRHSALNVHQDTPRPDFRNGRQSELNVHQDTPRPDFRNGHHSADHMPRGSGLLSRLEKFSGTWNDFEVVGDEVGDMPMLSSMSNKKKDLSRLESICNKVTAAKPGKHNHTRTVSETDEGKKMMYDRTRLESTYKKVPETKPDKVSDAWSNFEVVNSNVRRPAMLGSMSDKKMLSDKKRIETINSKLSESNAKQKLIKDSLRNLDTGVKANSKIVFDDDFGSKEADAPEKQSKKKTPKVSKERRNMALFESDSEEDSPMDSQDMFRVKPQYEGQDGQKNIALQSRFGNDERFKIDERFVESETEEVHDEEFNSNQERQRQLGVLESVLGYELPQKPKDKLTNEWKKISQMRYDPTLENAAEMEIHEEEQSVSKTGKRKGKADELPEEILPEVSQERYYKVSTSLKDIFNSGTKSGGESFSLLQSLGAAEPSEGAQDLHIVDAKTDDKASKLPRAAWNNNPFKYDSSSDEEDETEKRKPGGKQTPQASGKTQNETTESNSLNQPSSRRTFFVFEGDSRLEDGVKFFTQPENMNLVRQTWQQTRFSLMQEFREKLKKAQQEKVGKSKIATAAKRQFNTTKSKFNSKRKPFSRPRR